MNEFLAYKLGISLCSHCLTSDMDFLDNNRITLSSIFMLLFNIFHFCYCCCCYAAVSSRCLIVFLLMSHCRYYVWTQTNNNSNGIIFMPLCVCVWNAVRVLLPISSIDFFLFIVARFRIVAQWELTFMAVFEKSRVIKCITFLYSLESPRLFLHSSLQFFTFSFRVNFCELSATSILQAIELKIKIFDFGIVSV